jgi:hypothetical protein
LEGKSQVLDEAARIHQGVGWHGGGMAAGGARSKPA